MAEFLASDARATARAERIFEQHRDLIYRRTDRFFAGLMTVQYGGGILAAIFLAPRTWIGTQSSAQLHLWAAIFLGALILGYPIVLALLRSGHVATRHVIAVAQMIFSGLLVHLSGGRIETHFHIFGSLAILGFYRDWRVLASASVAVALDHFVRGGYWPETVYGVLSPSPLRWLEHTGWVLFENIFIGLAIRQSITEMREIAERRAYIEDVARERAADIIELREAKTELKNALASKDAFLSICGHELKTPLTSLSLQAQLTQRALARGILLRSSRAS